MAAILEANTGTAHAYGDDDWSRCLDEAFSELFETETRVLPVPTGTVANAIALACVTPPWGSVLCHRQAHIYEDESGAPEFYGHGLRLVPVDGADGKLDPAGLERTLRESMGHGVHSYAPAALSLTQCTEAGTVYQPAEIAALCEIAARHGLATHLDGARFGNALASLGCAPADVTWRAGIEMLSFGASKNGCLAAEALLFFGRQETLGTAERLRKRGGHLYSKMRYLSAQLLAYIEDGLWLDLARHANGQAERFAAAVNAHPTARLEFPLEANEAFVRWTVPAFEALAAAGIEFQTWPGQDDLARFVFAHSTRDEETDRAIAALRAITG
jgi:threonine aldolase